MNRTDPRQMAGQGLQQTGWSQLAWQDHLPDLEDFLRLVAVRSLTLAPGGVTAIGVPPVGISYLAPLHHQLTGLACRLTRKGGQPGWDAWPTAWDKGASGAHGEQGSGTGPWPDYWALPVTPVEGWAWREERMQVDGATLMTILFLYPANEEMQDQVRSGMASFGSELVVLLRVWVAARRAQAQLSRLGTENQALTRLNVLQEKAVALASHEFKTPLTSITAYTDALRKQITDEDFPHATEFLDVIRSEAGRLLRLVNRVSDQSRLNAGLELLEAVPTELPDLIEGAASALGPSLAEKNLHLTTDFAPHLPLVMADADLVRQVLVNLMSNAVKYTPADGSIEVVVTEREATVRISINDTGVGIAEEELQRIFREFYRTREQAALHEGTGLGLAIVRSIVNLHGGFVTARRRQPAGTSFAVHLPKEIHAPHPLPLAYTSRVDRDQAWRLVSTVCRLAAELTGSMAVEIQLPDPEGRPVTVASMGQGHTGGDAPWLTQDLGQGGGSCGRLRVGFPREGQGYDQPREKQLAVIAETAALALRSLLPEGAEGSDTSSSTLVAKVAEAVQAILQIRRSGVPTSTADALDLTEKLGKAVKHSPEGTRRLCYAALLHDAGMARVEVEIVMGTSALSWDQRDEVERHVEQGLELMAPLLPDPETRSYIAHHHERFDGQGYPTGLKGEDIPLGARLLAVIDTWFALTRERPYRPCLSPEKAWQELEKHSGSQFDATVVRAFGDVLVSEGIIPGFPAPTHLDRG